MNTSYFDMPGVSLKTFKAQFYGQWTDKIIMKSIEGPKRVSGMFQQTCKGGLSGFDRFQFLVSEPH